MTSKNTEIHLFRHGETDWNVEGRFQGIEISKLTEKGVLQAKQLGNKLKKIKFDNIYSSPSLRTKQTAYNIWPNKKDKIQFLDELVEIRLGRLEGKLYSDIKQKYIVENKLLRIHPRTPTVLAGAGRLRANSLRTKKTEF